MSLTEIGAVEVHIHMPQFSESASPDSHGLTPFGVSGMMLWASARTLDELAANDAARTTIAGRSGVLVQLVFTGDEQEALTGQYLLQNFNLGEYGYIHRKIGRVPFSLAAQRIRETS